MISTFAFRTSWLAPLLMLNMAPLSAALPAGTAETLASNGIAVEVMKDAPEGSASPMPRDKILASYIISQKDGTVIARSPQDGPEWITLPDAPALWLIAVPHMHIGDEWRLTLRASQTPAAGKLPDDTIVTMNVTLKALQRYRGGPDDGIG